MDFDDHPDGVIVAGADGTVEYVNQRVAVMAKAVGDEMIGMHRNTLSRKIAAYRIRKSA